MACAKCHNMSKNFKKSIQNARRNSLQPNAVSQKTWSEELETALSYNDQLEKENARFRVEIHELAIKNEKLLQALTESKGQFEADLGKLRNELKTHEKQLGDKAQKHSEQQSTFLDEIKQLKQENADVRRQKTESEELLNEKLKSFKREIKIYQLDNSNLRASSKVNEQKCLKYKEKLKQALKIVNDLNSIVAEYRTRREIVNETTQTEAQNMREKPHPLDCSQGNNTRYKGEIYLENLLLSDVFFKPKTFLDSEIELFKVRPKSNSSLKMHR